MAKRRRPRTTFLENLRRASEWFLAEFEFLRSPEGGNKEPVAAWDEALKASDVWFTPRTVEGYEKPFDDTAEWTRDAMATQAILRLGGAIPDRLEASMVARQAADDRMKGVAALVDEFRRACTLGDAASLAKARTALAGLLAKLRGWEMPDTFLRRVRRIIRDVLAARVPRDVAGFTADGKPDSTGLESLFVELLITDASAPAVAELRSRPPKSFRDLTDRLSTLFGIRSAVEQEITDSLSLHGIDGIPYYTACTESELKETFLEVGR